MELVLRKILCYIFDVDDTLLNYRNAEKNIMFKISEYENENINDRILENLWDRSCYWWDKYELDNTNTEKNQHSYHKMFRQYLYNFMKDIKGNYSLSSKVENLCKLFRKYLEEEKTLFPETDEILNELSRKSNLIIATNGFDTIQKRRTEKISSYFSNIFVSESLGIIKPNQMFWEKIFEKIPYLPRDRLMVGDSLIN